MPRLIKKTLIVAKAEAVPGTDIVPTGVNAILVRNCTITPIEMTYAERNLVRSFFGNFDSLPAITKTKIAFEVEMQSSNTAGTAPAWDDLMQACGMSSTNTPVTKQEYLPLSGTGKTVSIYYNVDGGLHKVTWARGNCTIKLKANDIPVFAFELMGLDQGLTDTALLTPTYTGYITPTVANTVNTPTFSLHAIATLAVENLEINFGNQVELIQRIGGQHVEQTDRKTTGTVMFEMTTVAAKDWFAAVKAATLGALSVIHGTVAGKIVELSAPAVQLKSPTFSDVQGIQMVQFALNINPTAAGNDEFKIIAR